MKKHTKIVATISDIRCEIDFIRQLYEAGMNVVRINTAHASYEGIARIVKNVREVSQRIAILIDTKGPEIRTTHCIDNLSIELKAGSTIRIVGDPTKETDNETIYVSYQKIAEEISLQSHILFDDGEIAVIVDSKDNNALICTVLNSGKLGSRKSVNIPGVRIDLPSVTDRDKGFIKFATENDIDFIAHSFVRCANDVREVQQELDKYNSPIKIIAKIENQEGLNNIEEILEHVYGIMIARGDLGIEVPQEKIPLIQRQLIRKCVESKKPVIVATQMLHTMIQHPRPTRAEVTDVANAIYYRTDAIMLSGETATGDYPVESVETMTRIAREVESAKEIQNDIPIDLIKNDVRAYLADAAVKATKGIPIKAVLTDSLTGRTARYLSAFRGAIPVFALCYNKRVGRELALSYGVSPRLTESGSSKSQILYNSIEKLKSENLLQNDHLIAYLGSSFGIGGGTTYLEIITVEGFLEKIEHY
ncbi:MAG: pyruvate kinase [Marinilabiliaceae bacterium]|nr:pyruvate kinase [Marinilabiliaceae bacterium]